MHYHHYLIIYIVFQHLFNVTHIYIENELSQDSYFVTNKTIMLHITVIYINYLFALFATNFCATSTTFLGLEILASDQ